MRRYHYHRETAFGARCLAALTDYRGFYFLELTLVREEVLRRFFQGEATASELAKDVADSTKPLSDTASRVRIEDMDESFTVTRPMLISLCDAVVAGSLPPQELRTIGFALESSDKFEWDGDADELVADVIADWSCPEINYPLTVENGLDFELISPARSHTQASLGRSLTTRGESFL